MRSAIANEKMAAFNPRNGGRPASLSVLMAVAAMATLLSSLAFAQSETVFGAGSKNRGGCLSLRAEPGTTDPPTSSSITGDPSKDAIIRQKIEMHQKMLERSFKIGFTLQYDANQNQAWSDSDNRLIVLGVPLLRSVYKGAAGRSADAGEAADAAVLFILAHEVAHQVQYRVIRDPEYDNPHVMWLELEADGLAAGWLMYNSFWDPQRLNNVLATIYSIGDTGFTDLDHHGMPPQRALYGWWGMEYVRRGIGDPGYEITPIGFHERYFKKHTPFSYAVVGATAVLHGVAAVPKAIATAPVWAYGGVRGLIFSESEPTSVPPKSRRVDFGDTLKVLDSLTEKASVKGFAYTADVGAQIDDLLGFKPDAGKASLLYVHGANNLARSDPKWNESYRNLIGARKTLDQYKGQQVEEPARQEVVGHFTSAKSLLSRVGEGNK